jgi:sulfur carrier protein
MNIYINSKQHELPGEAKITDALTSINIVGQKGIAIAVNNTVVPRAEWETHVLQTNDQVTIIKATQGG